MIKMKILYIAHPLAFQLYGGSEFQLEKYYEILKKSFSIKLFDPFKDDFSEFNIIHNFTLNPDMGSMLEFAKSKGLKIITNANYWNLEKIVWNNKDFPLIKRMGYVLSSKLAKTGLFDWLFSVLNPSLVYLYGQKKILNLSDVIIANSYSEKNLLIKDFKIKPEKIKVVYNGVDEEFKYGNPDLFFKKYGMKDFVLYTGRIEPKKNILALIKAAKKLQLPLVIIGNYNLKYPKYLESVKKEIKNSKILILPYMKHDSEMLRSAYKACKVFALVSFGESPGLSALEAGLAGANLVVTEIGSTKEYFSNFAFYVNPSSQKDIENKLKQAFEKEKNNKLSKHIEKHYLWSKVLSKKVFKEIYHE